MLISFFGFQEMKECELPPGLKFSSQFWILILNDEIFYSHEHRM